MLISQTPLRISFAGGGTDLEDYYRSEEGTVISTAIDKYIFVLVKELYDDKIVLSWTIKEIVNNLENSVIAAVILVMIIILVILGLR